MGEMLTKYIVPFDCFEKKKNCFNCKCSISIVSFAFVIGEPVGIASSSFSLAFPVSTGIVKNCSKRHEIKRKSRRKLLC